MAINPATGRDDEEDRPGMSLMIPPAPAHEEATRHQESPTTSTVQPTYQYDPQQALQDTHAQAKDEIQLAAEKRQSTEGIASQQAAEELKAAKQQETDRQSAIDKAQPTIDAWTEKLREARDRYQEQPFPSLFADQPDSKRAMLAIGLAVSVFADATAARANAMLGGQGRAPGFLDSIIDSDIARQKDKIKGLSDRVVMAKTGLQDAQEARKLLIADADVKGATMFRQAGLMARANLTSQKLSPAAIDEHAAVIAANNKELEYKHSAAKELASQVTTQREGDVTTTTDRDQAPAKESGLASLRRDRIAANIHEYENAAKQLTPGIITPDVLDKVQRNELLMHNAQHNEGAIGTVLNLAGRSKLPIVGGTIPKSRYEGLTEDQARAMQALDTMAQHGSEMQPSTGVEVSAQWKAQAMPKAGTSQQLIDERLASLKEAGAAYHAIIDPTNIGGRAAGIGTPAPGAALPGLDERNMPQRQPGPSAPAGPAVETPDNSPDNVNSEAALPETSDASIDDFQSKQMARGKAHAAAPVAPPPPPPPLIARPQRAPGVQAVIDEMKRDPRRRDPAVMRMFKITEDDLR